MSRLQKKCLFASAMIHGFLLFLVVFGTAFFLPRKKVPPMEQLRVVPTKLIDAAFSGGGGDPNVPRTDEQVKAAEPPQPAPPPPKPQPKREEPKREEPKKPTPPKEVPKKLPKELPKKPAKVEKTEPPKIELKAVTRTRVDEEAERAKTAARARQQAQRQAANRINRVLDTLRDGFQQGTVVQVHGPGGAAYANYAQFVKAKYEDAWVVLGDFADDDATATVTVTIAREGYVISSRISKRSGDGILDRSVQAALDKVKFVAPFPEGATEASRTFTINFNLKAKRLAG